MLQTYHPMNDAKYLAGVGTGASMALALAACRPPFVAAVLAVGGQLSAAALAQATYAPLPVYLVNGDAATRDYFIKANDAQTTATGQNAGQLTYACVYNPLQQVIIGPRTCHAHARSDQRHLY